MFLDDYNLRSGDGEMGVFVKDWLYEKRDDDLPRGPASLPPNNHHPSRYSITNESRSPFKQITIYNVSGKKVISTQPTNEREDHKRWETFFSSGVYLLESEDAVEAKSKKIIIR